MQRLKHLGGPQLIFAAAGILLFPPVLLLASHISYQPTVAGRWSQKLFLAIVISGGFALLGSSFAAWTCLTESGARLTSVALKWVRARRLLLSAAVLIPIAIWLGLLLGVFVLQPPPSFKARIWIALADFGAIVVLWETWLLWTERSKSQRRLLLMRCMAISCGVVASIVVAEIIGALVGLEPRDAWRINPPNQTARWKSVEFDTRIVINAQGLREPKPIAAAHPNNLRVVVVGDSMTFGHGVDYEHTYPFVAQTILQDKYGRRNVEVVNVARQGASPADYLRFMRKCVAELSPDLIVIGFYAGNDCPVQQPFEQRTSRQIQALRESFLQPESSRVWERSLFCRLFDRRLIQPLKSRLDGSAQAAPGTLDPLYQSPNALGQLMVSGKLTGPYRERFDMMEERGWVEKGLNYDVNPGIIRGAIMRPNSVADMMFLREESQEAMRAEWRLCRAVLEEVLGVARRITPNTSFIVIPHGYQIDPQCADQLRNAWSCNLPESAIGSRVLNDLAVEFCHDQDVSCLDPMAKFIEATQDGQQLYFPIDSHFTPQGHALLASILAEWIDRQLGEL